MTASTQTRAETTLAETGSRAVAEKDAAAPAWSLAAALLGFFVVTLDPVIVNVALPDIRRDLAGESPGLGSGGRLARQPP